MTNVVLSSRASKDMVEVLEYTREHWGEAKALEYGQLITESLAEIASNPACGKIRLRDRPDILALPIRRPGHPARHILYYRIRDTATAEVVRFLHDAMDLAGHLP